MNELEIYETVKEFSVYTDMMKEPIKARISKIKQDNTTNPDLYIWTISHYYKPDNKSIDVYIPSRTFSDSFNDVEKLLMKYINEFTGIGVKKNDLF